MTHAVRNGSYFISKTPSSTFFLIRINNRLEHFNNVAVIAMIRSRGVLTLKGIPKPSGLAITDDDDDDDDGDDNQENEKLEERRK
jgi:hypothetical protein